MSRGRTPLESVVEVAGVRVIVTRKRVKNLNLRVHPPDGVVRLSAPLGTPPAAIDRLIRERLDWIHRHRRRIRQLPRPVYREYLSGEVISVLGQQLNLRFVPRDHGQAAMRDKPSSVAAAVDRLTVTLPVPLGATRELRKRALENWLRRQARREFAAEVARWEPRMGVKVEQLGIKRMKTRWGTCNPSARRVWLNLALLERPPACLEYVVVHELAHLSVADHSPAFWAVVERHLPGWRRAKAQLARAPLWLEES